MKKIIFILLIIALLLPAAAMAGKPIKHTFNDVLLPDDQIGEIEATSKAKHVICSYFTNDYVNYLGRYDEHIEATDILQFCLDNYNNRTE